MYNVGHTQPFMFIYSMYPFMNLKLLDIELVV